MDGEHAYHLQVHAHGTKEDFYLFLMQQDLHNLHMMILKLSAGTSILV